MTEVEFITKSIMPYILDRSKCGIEPRGNCAYLTKEGKKCVFGQYIEEWKEEYEEQNASNLIEKYTKNILVEEARNHLSPYQWDLLQSIHDNIAMDLEDKHNILPGILSRLEKQLSISLTEIRKALDL